MDDGAAHTATKLVAVERRLGRADIAPVVGVKDGVAHVFKDRAMPIIGSGFGQHVNDAVGEAAVLGAIAVGLDAEFLYGIGVGRNVAGIAKSRYVRGDIGVVVHRAGGAIHAAVDQGALLRVAQSYAGSIVFLHAGRQSQERINVAVDQRQRSYLLGLHGAANLRVGDVDQGKRVVDFHGRAGGAGLQAHIGLRDLGDFKHEAGADLFLEIWSRHFELIVADGKKFEPVCALVVGLGDVTGVGISVNRCNLRAGNHGTD